MINHIAYGKVLAGKEVDSNIILMNSLQDELKV